MACTTLVATRDTICDYIPTKDTSLFAGFESGEVKVAGVSLNKTNATIGVGDDLQLSAVVKPSNATNNTVTYTSSAEAVATVNGSGVVTGVSQGNAIITVATTNGNFTATCNITVDGKNAAQISNDIDGALAQLEAQVDGHVNPAQMKQTVDAALNQIGSVESIASKAESNENVAEKLQELETAYTAAAGVDVVDPATDNDTKDALKEVFGDDVNTNLASVSGAGLNAEPNQTAKVNIAPTPENDKKNVEQEGFNSVAQIDMTLKVGGDGVANTEVHQLTAPIIITLPLPKNIQKSKLFVLHYYADGTFELIKPVLSHNSMTITVWRFSTFAIVELAEGEAVTNGGGNDNNQNPPNDSNNGSSNGGQSQDDSDNGGKGGQSQGGSGSQNSSGSSNSGDGNQSQGGSDGQISDDANNGVKDGQAENNSGDSDPAKPDSSSKTKKGKEDPYKAKITQDKEKIKASKLKKKDQKVTVKIEKSKGKITAKNESPKKIKKYLKVKVKGRKVICTIKKGAPKGTYKVKVTVAKKGKFKKTTKTIRIVVK